MRREQGAEFTIQGGAMSAYRKLEGLANVAIISVSLLLGWVLVTRFLSPGPSPPRPGRANPLQAGKRMNLAGVNWLANKRTLILFLRKDCQFCTQGEFFYQRLVAAAMKNRVSLIALLPDELTAAKAYLRTLGLEIQDVRQANLKELDIPVTPTVLLVNDSGAVEHAWVGKLPPDKEAEVLRTIE